MMLVSLIPAWSKKFFILCVHLFKVGLIRQVDDPKLELSSWAVLSIEYFRLTQNNPSDTHIYTLEWADNQTKTSKSQIQINLLPSKMIKLNQSGDGGTNFSQNYLRRFRLIKV